MTRAKGYVDAEYLRVVARLFGPLKQRSFECMRIAPGNRLLDVGCGTGADTVALALLTDRGGQVIGVDTDPRMLAAADERAKQAGAAAWVRHQRADAIQLPFGDGEFDACRSERLFQHLPDPEKALGEMMRVTRAGGRIVVLDTDWGTATVDVSEVDIERRLMRFLTERMHHNGYSGRRLHRMFRSAGLQDVAVEAFAVPVVGSSLVRQILTADKLEREARAAGAVNDEELERWRASLTAADDAGGCYFCATLMLAQGTKPTVR